MRGVNVTAPVALYLAVGTGTPTNTGAGLSEIVGSGYARKPVAFGAVTGGGPSQTVNNVEVLFDEASGLWGDITGWIIYDAPSGGNPYYYGNFDTPENINNGDQLVVRTGTLRLTEN